MGHPGIRHNTNPRGKINVNLFAKPEVDGICGLEDDDDVSSVRAISQAAGEEVIRLIVKETMTQYKEIFEKVNQLIKRFTSKKQEKVSEKEEEIQVNTLYKKKGVKVHPRDDIPSDGSIPEGDPMWKEKKWEKVKGKLQKDSKYDN